MYDLIQKNILYHSNNKVHPVIHVDMMFDVLEIPSL
jgi:hypothetical protein